MKSLLQQALGDDWHRLPPALQRHYRPGTTLEVGAMDVEYPLFMQPLLALLSRLGALVHRRGRGVQTHVEKSDLGPHQQWRRTLRYDDGPVLHFDSVWEAGAPGQVVEFVNRWLGLRMQPFVVGDELHYRGLHVVVRLGRREWPVAEWLALGHTTIVERAVDEHHFAMDFRLTHPLFGQVFRYAGRFRADAEPSAGPATPAPRGLRAAAPAGTCRRRGR